jgi:hypothetical protein
MNSGEQILIGAVTDPAFPPGDVSADVLDAMERHRLAPLAWDTLRTSGHAASWPAPIQMALRRASAAQALVTALIDTELRRVIATAGDAGVRMVLIKGAALANTHYRLAHLRPRSDSDVVILDADRETTAHMLSELGYLRTPAIEGSLITQQVQWTRELAAGVVHAVDVHWRVFNPHLFGEVLSTEKLIEKAIPVPLLGPRALAPCTADALLLACVHRIAHHPGEEDPIWDFDIHLLLSSLTHDDAAAFARSASAANVRAVCAAAIASATSRFGTRLPAGLRVWLDHAADAREPTAVFLDPGRRQVDMLASDFAALPTWRARAGLLRQHLFPAPRYLLRKYGRRSWVWLPLLYVRRIAEGMPRWLRSERS